MSSMLSQALKPGAIRLELQASTKEEAIHELIGVLTENEHLADPGAAERVVIARERTMSTGMKNGIALPHGKTDTVDRLVAAIGVKQEGIAFDSPDGKPAQLVILTLSPASKAGPHIQFMAEVARLLRTPESVATLIASQTPEAMLSLLTQNKNH